MIEKTPTANSSVEPTLGARNLNALFLGGTGRSGTTILKSILLRNESVIGCNNELRFIVDPDGAIDLFRNLSVNWDPFRASVAVENFDWLIRSSLKGNVLYSGLRYSLSKVKISPLRYRHIRLKSGRREMLQIHEKFIERIGESHSRSIWYGSKSLKIDPSLIETKAWSESDLSILFADHFSALFKAMQPDKVESSRYWLDDTPYCILNATILKSMFPDSKFIHIYRDPRSVVASYMLQTWGGAEKNLSSIAYRVKNVYKKIQVEQNNISEADFINVKFESLLENPVSELGAIAEKINCTYSAEASHLINKKKAASYGNFFADSQLKIINEILAEELEYLEYESGMM